MSHDTRASARTERDDITIIMHYNADADADDAVFNFNAKTESRTLHTSRDQHPPIQVNNLVGVKVNDSVPKSPNVFSCKFG